MNTEPALKSIVDLIIRCVDPDAIVLFGSVAQRRVRPDSDIDLLVLAPFREPKRHRGLELRGLLERYALPIELHLLTPTEFEAAAAGRFSFADTVDRHGVRLYERETGH